MDTIRHIIKNTSKYIRRKSYRCQRSGQETYKTHIKIKTNTGSEIPNWLCDTPQDIIKIHLPQGEIQNLEDIAPNDIKDKKKNLSTTIIEALSKAGFLYSSITKRLQKKTS